VAIRHRETWILLGGSVSGGNQKSVTKRRQSQSTGRNVKSRGEGSVCDLLEKVNAAAMAETSRMLHQKIPAGYAGKSEKQNSSENGLEVHKGHKII